MKIIETYLLMLFLIITICCSNSSEKKNQSSDKKSIKAIGYNLSDPDGTIILPDILHEISGITVIDSVSLACIQDERGIIFVFDLLKNEIRERIAFNMDGDYEGIAKAGNIFYILRSDGVLLEIENAGSSVIKWDFFPTGIPAMNNEGLCYDRDNDRLLIAPKENFDRFAVKKQTRPVYAYDLLAGRLVSLPVFNFDLSDINRFAVDTKVIHKTKDKKKNEKNEPDIEFKPSELGINPVTKDLYILSGVENMLFVFHSSGTIKYIEKLNPEIFNAPEGIAFLKNGDMFISNEGQNRKATLLRFNYTRH